MNIIEVLDCLRGYLSKYQIGFCICQLVMFLILINKKEEYISNYQYVIFKCLICYSFGIYGYYIVMNVLYQVFKYVYFKVFDFNCDFVGVGLYCFGVGFFFV